MTDKGNDKIAAAAEKAMTGLKPEDIQKLLSDPSSMSHQLAAHINQAMGQDQLSALPLAVRKRIRALKNFQLETTKLEAKFYLEVQKLEAKYLALYQPVYDKRRDIVTGSCEPTDEEAHWSEDDDDDDEEEEKKDKKPDSETSKTICASDTNGADAEVTSGIKDFWLIALKNSDIFADIIKEHDEPVLSCLTDIKTIYANDSGLAFTLEFHFAENEWFTNKVLTKSYTVACEVNKEDPWAFEGASITEGKGCFIDWKKGKNLTVKVVKKKQKHKGKGQGQTRTKTIANETFFNAFSLPSLNQKGGGALNEDEDDLAQTLSNDYTRAEFIRDRLIPKAVLFYTGEALDEDGEDEDFDDFDEDDDDLEDDYNPQKDVADVKQPECNQQ